MYLIQRVALPSVIVAASAKLQRQFFAGGRLGGVLGENKLGSRLLGDVLADRRGQRGIEHQIFPRRVDSERARRMALVATGTLESGSGRCEFSIVIENRCDREVLNDREMGPTRVRGGLLHQQVNASH